MSHKRKCDTGKIGAPSEAGDDNVRVFTGQLHLLFCLKTYDCLMQRDMIEDTAKSVATVRRSPCKFHGLGYGCTERAVIVGIHSQNIFSGTCAHTWRWGYLCPKHLHHSSSVRFLFVAQLHLIHSALQPEKFACIRQSGTPLSGARLCGDIGDTLFLTVISLGDCRVEFV